MRRCIGPGGGRSSESMQRRHSLQGSRRHNQAGGCGWRCLGMQGGLQSDERRRQYVEARVRSREGTRIRRMSIENDENEKKNP